MISEIIPKDKLFTLVNLNEYIDSSVNGSVFACEWFIELKQVKDFVVVKDNAKVVLIMPLFRNPHNEKTINQSTMYIPYGGPVIKQVPKEERNKIRYLRQLNSELIKILKANFSAISFSTDSSIDDIMPYIRSGFMPELRYTYKLDISHPDTLYQNYGHDRRKEIRKANANNLQFILDAELNITNINKFVEWESKYGFDSSVNEVKDILKNAIKNDNGMVFVAIKDDIVIGAVGNLR